MSLAVVAREVAVEWKAEAAELLDVIQETRTMSSSNLGDA
jgi:hypothetical protein